MDKKTKVLKPFTPVKVKAEANKITVDVIGRTYTIENGEIFSSIIVNGKELLTSPMRITGIEDGEEIVWTKRKFFLHSNDDEKAIIISTLESKMIDLNIVITIEYDGYCDIKLRAMTTSYNMAQRLRLEPWPTWKYQLSKLWIETPLKLQDTSLYTQYPKDTIYKGKETLVESNFASCSGFLPNENFNIPFKALFWLGNENQGLGFSAENDKGIQLSDQNCYIDSVIEGDTRIIRNHLLDSVPVTWVNPRHDATYFFPPVFFGIGLQATPVKPFPKNSRITKSIQFYGKDLTALDKPIFENSSLSGYDEIKKLGIDTVFVHETWNKIQNTPNTDSETLEQFKHCIKEFHKRKIKVMPYFGYEISSISPNFEKEFDEYRVDKGELASQDATWWREPWQRDYAVCYGSDFKKSFTDGIEKLVKKFKFDGIYLDGTIFPRQCFNVKHGCGFMGNDGKLHGTYPLEGIRETMKKIYQIFEPRGGIICYHSGCLNFSAMGFTHVGWTGEIVQVGLIKEGADKLSTGFMRAEWGGKNFGIPMEMIVYPNPPTWTFEQATALGLVHNILPRPQYSLEGGLKHARFKNFQLVSSIWKATDKFNFAKSTYHPYWEKESVKLANNDNIACSYYQLDNNKQILVYLSNLKTVDIENVKVELNGYKSTVLGQTATINSDNTITFKPFTYAIVLLTK